MSRRETNKRAARLAHDIRQLIVCDAGSHIRWVWGITMDNIREFYLQEAKHQGVPTRPVSVPRSLRPMLGRRVP